jgi:heat shock protein HslJ
LEGVEWVLDAASAGSLVDKVPDQARVDLQFQDGQFGGRSACNNYGGDYEADDGSISFDQMQVTAMACDEPVMALESAYLEALGAATGFQISDAGLVLTGGQVALTFSEG